MTKWLGNTIGLRFLPEHLPPKLLGQPTQSAPPSSPTSAAVVEQRRRDLWLAEKRQTEDAIAACGGNRTQAAELLGISRRTMVDRAKEYGLPPRRRPVTPPEVVEAGGPERDDEG